MKLIRIMPIRRRVQKQINFPKAGNAENLLILGYIEIGNISLAIAIFLPSHQK